MIAILEELRASGWTVAVHNDYRLGGKPMTFWLFTHHSGVWAKGEGSTDEEALAAARQQATERLAEKTPATCEGRCAKQGCDSRCSRPVGHEGYCSCPGPGS